MAHNYLSNPKASFFAEEEDVDDDTFLQGSRNNYQGYSSSNYNRGTDPQQERLQQLYEKRREIENRTLESSQRSLGVLRESEQIGVATAEELLHQREQLERTEKRLDEINSTLRVSQKHIQGIKSVFGSFKNYLSGRSADKVPTPSKVTTESSGPSFSDSPLAQTVSQSRPEPGASYGGDQATLSARQYNPKPVSSDPFAEQLDRNLVDMADSLSRLKGLGIGLSEEIEAQNDLLDNITDKTEKADVTLMKQNKDMTRLMKK